MQSKLLLTTALALSIFAGPGICQDNPKTAATQAKETTASGIKGWFKHKKSPNSKKVNETKQKALKIPAGSQVKLKTTDGVKTKGTLTSVSNDAISVMPGTAAAQSIAYGNIKSLKKTRGPRLTVSNGAPANPKLNSSLDAIPPGSPVNLKLNDKTQLQGRYQSETADNVDVQVPQDGKMVTRTIPKAQIAGVSVAKPGLFHKPKLESPDLEKKRISALPVGSPINFKTPNGQPVSGKLAGTTDTGFSVQTLEGGNIVTKDYPYDQVASVKPPTPSFKQRIPGLHAPKLQTGPQIKAAALGIPAGSPVTLKMPDGSKTVGKLMGVSNDGLQVQSVQGGNIVNQSVGYDQIGSIQQGVPTPPSTRAKKIGKAGLMVIVTGVVSGVLAKKL